MFQRVTLIGRVGQDPVMRYTPDGTPVTTISLATTETITKTKFDGGDRPCPGGWKESYNGKNWEVTTWFRVTFWRGAAETVNTYVTKGSQLFVEGIMKGEAKDGTMDPRVWADQSGEHRASFELTARQFKFIGKSNGGVVHDEPPPEGHEMVGDTPF